MVALIEQRTIPKVALESLRGGDVGPIPFHFTQVLVAFVKFHELLVQLGSLGQVSK